MGQKASCRVNLEEGEAIHVEPVRGPDARPGGTREAAPSERGGRGTKGLLQPQAWPQLLPLPSANNPKLKTAQAKQQQWAGQGAGSHPLLARQPLPKDSWPWHTGSAMGHLGVLHTGLSHPGIGVVGLEEPRKQELVSSNYSCTFQFFPGWYKEDPFMASKHLYPPRAL